MPGGFFCHLFVSEFQNTRRPHPGLFKSIHVYGLFVYPKIGHHNEIQGLDQKEHPDAQRPGYCGIRAEIGHQCPAADAESVSACNHAVLSSTGNVFCLAHAGYRAVGLLWLYRKYPRRARRTVRIVWWRRQLFYQNNGRNGMPTEIERPICQIPLLGRHFSGNMQGLVSAWLLRWFLK